MAVPDSDQGRFSRQLNRTYAWFGVGLLVFLLLMAALERAGLPRSWIGLGFLIMTVLVYGVIGFVTRTTDEVEYYVAGRRVPALYNGMATAADWMSAASFIGLAGTLYLTGFSGLAFVMGWTGGYCLVALLLAPYLRRFARFTISDFLGERYEGHLPRILGVISALLCSFVYVVAQIYGVGLIASHLTGLPFEIGVFVGLGGILLCSSLGGMKAVTWTQVAQCIILLVAYLVPVVWLSTQQTGVPLPQLVYGQQLQQVSAREAQIAQDPGELEVMAIHRRRAEDAQAKLLDVPAAMSAEREALTKELEQLKAQSAPMKQIQALERRLSALPVTEEAARRRYESERSQALARASPLGGMPEHAAVFGSGSTGRADGASSAQGGIQEAARANFLALIFCLMVGTASLPHILMRSYTTPTVKAARDSVTWSLVFISLLYFTAPALAVLVKFEILSHVVGLPFDQLPAWMNSWARIDPSLLSVSDVNRDGVLQLGELRIGADIVTLATPEIGGMPYVVTALVAAGGLAAALSTADGLLLTIANALSHDVYYKVLDPQASTARRVAISKALLLVVAMAAAILAAQKPADILFLVSAAFSIAASAFFPALVLGIFWSRANRAGACAGMVCGLAVTGYYMVRNQPWLRQVFGVDAPVDLWWGIQPISAGLFGVAAGTLALIVVSLLTRPPGAQARAVLDSVRFPANLPEKG